MHRQRSKKELMLDLQIQSLERQRSVGDILEIGRRVRGDRNIQLGHNIAHGLDLVELMMHYDMTDDELIHFAKKHDEFMSKYESGNPQDRDEVLGMFEELQKRTGYNVLSGRIE